MEVVDGVNGVVNGLGSGFSICRLKDYVVFVIIEDVVYDFDVVLNVVLDIVNKFCILNILFFFIEDQVIELLVVFGKFKSFILVKDCSIEELRVGVIKKKE